MMSRRDRRRLARQSQGAEIKTKIEKVALCCREKCEDGRELAVTDPVAIKVLVRAFTQFFRQGCRPLCSQISIGEAQAFPSKTQDKPGMVYALAVAADKAGRPSFCVQGVELNKAAGGMPTPEDDQRARAFAYDVAEGLALAQAINFAAEI